MAAMPAAADAVAGFEALDLAADLNHRADDLAESDFNFSEQRLLQCSHLVTGHNGELCAKVALDAVNVAMAHAGIAE